MILVTGAAGKTGRAIVRSIAGQGRKIKALIRHPEQTESVKNLGASKVIIGDMIHPDTIRLAYQNVSAVYFICPNVHPEEAAIGRIMIEAAASAGVSHFVYHSVLHPQIEAMPHHWNKMRVEEMLFASGLPYTILQPAVYMQNIQANWKTIQESGKYSAPYSVNSQISYVDLNDVSQAVSKVFYETRYGDSGSHHRGATYELAGTAGVSLEEIAAMITNATHCHVTAERIPVEIWQKKAGVGVSGYRLEALVKMFRYYDQHGLTSNPHTLGWLLDRPPTSLDAFIDRMIQGYPQVAQ